MASCDATTAVARAAVREWIGSTPGDLDLDDLLAVHGGRPYETARAVLGVRLADLLGSVNGFSVAGQITVGGTSAAVTALKERLAELQPLVDAERRAGGLPVVDATAVVTSRVTRPDQARLPGLPRSGAF